MVEQLNRLNMTTFVSFFFFSRLAEPVLTFYYQVHVVCVIRIVAC